MYRFLIYTFAAMMLLLSSCQEKEWDYDYHVVNMTGEQLELTYTDALEKKDHTLSLADGADTLLLTREDVTGKDVWGIESASQIYVFSALEGTLHGSLFSDNLRLMQHWTGPEKVDGRGIYTLYVTRDLFNTKYQTYYYRLHNASETHDLRVAVRVGNSTDSLFIPRGETAVVGQYKTKGTSVEDLYEKDKVSNIYGITISMLLFVRDNEQLPSNRFRVNTRKYWTFDTEGEGDTQVGIYYQQLDNSICD